MPLDALPSQKLDEQQREDLINERHALKKLLEHVGWQQLQKLVRAQALMRDRMNARNPINGLDSAFDKAYSQGEAAGMLLVIELPALLIDDITEQLGESNTDAS